MPIDGARPADLPPGYHDFFAVGALSDGEPLRVIVSPGRCHLPADLRLWGWAVQLYSARSRASWGIGDLADLARLGSWARRLGAGMLMVNPLGAIAPTLPQEASPYYPGSRRFLNPLYLSIEAVAGYESLASELAPLAAEAHALESRAPVDRPRRGLSAEADGAGEIVAGVSGDELERSSANEESRWPNSPHTAPWLKDWGPIGMTGTRRIAIPAHPPCADWATRQRRPPPILPMDSMAVGRAIGRARPSD